MSDNNNTHVIIRLRRGTAQEWQESFPQPEGEILRLGEPGFEKDTGKLKIGDGITPWNSLPYLQAENDEDVILQPEDVQDVIGDNEFFKNGNNIEISYDDQQNTLTIDTSDNASFTNLSVTSLSGLDADFTSSLTVNNIDVSVEGHAHTHNDIIDFDNSVDELITVKDIVNGTGTTVTSNNGIYSVNVIASGSTEEFDKISFNIAADPTIETGEIGWDAAEGTLDLGLEGDVKIHIGEHNYFRIRNETANTIYAGQAVYASDVHNNILIEATPYTADGSIREIRFIGLVLSDVAKNQKGYAINFGHIENLDTRGNGAVNGAQNLYAADEPVWVEGDILYVHPTIPGKLTKIEPKHSVSAAIVLYVHQNHGRIFVRPTSYGHLDDNHDVDLTNLQNDNLLVYNSATENWEASANLTYDDKTLRIVADQNIGNFRINQFFDDNVEPPRMIFRRGRGTQASTAIANSEDGIFAIRGESFDYNGSPNILGGLRMEVVDPASPTSLHPSTRIFLRTSSGGDNVLDKTVYLDPDGTLRNTGRIQGTNFYQPLAEDNILNGSLTVNNGLNAPTLVYNNSTLFYTGSVNVSIIYDIDKQIQTFLNIPAATTDINFIEGSGWPASDSVDVLLELEFNSSVNVTWSLVDDWYNPPPSFVAGKYLVLLRSINGTIQGHYIGEKTN